MTGSHVADSGDEIIKLIIFKEIQNWGDPKCSGQEP